MRPQRSDQLSCTVERPTITDAPAALGPTVSHSGKADNNRCARSARTNCCTVERPTITDAPAALGPTVLHSGKAHNNHCARSARSNCLAQWKGLQIPMRPQRSDQLTCTVERPTNTDAPAALGPTVLHSGKAHNHRCARSTRTNRLALTRGARDSMGHTAPCYTVRCRVCQRES